MELGASHCRTGSVADTGQNPLVLGKWPPSDDVQQAAWMFQHVQVALMESGTLTNQTRGLDLRRHGS